MSPELKQFEKKFREAGDFTGLLSILGAIKMSFKDFNRVIDAQFLQGQL